MHAPHQHANSTPSFRKVWLQAWACMLKYHQNYTKKGQATALSWYSYKQFNFPSGWLLHGRQSMHAWYSLRCATCYLALLTEVSDLQKLI